MSSYCFCNKKTDFQKNQLEDEYRIEEDKKVFDFNVTIYEKDRISFNGNEKTRNKYGKACDIEKCAEFAAFLPDSVYLDKGYIVNDIPLSDNDFAFLDPVIYRFDFRCGFDLFVFRSQGIELKVGPYNKRHELAKVHFIQSRHCHILRLQIDRR